jgi:hypothetical protein
MLAPMFQSTDRCVSGLVVTIKRRRPWQWAAAISSNKVWSIRLAMTRSRGFNPVCSLPRLSARNLGLQSAKHRCTAVDEPAAARDPSRTVRPVSVKASLRVVRGEFLNCRRDRQSYAPSEWATLSSKSLCHLSQKSTARAPHFGC